MAAEVFLFTASYLFPPGYEEGFTSRLLDKEFIIGDNCSFDFFCDYDSPKSPYL